MATSLECLHKGGQDLLKADSNYHMPMAKDSSGCTDLAASPRATTNQQKKEEVRGQDIQMNYPICCYALQLLYPDNSLKSSYSFFSPLTGLQGPKLIGSEGKQNKKQKQNWPVYVLSTLMPNSSSWSQFSLQGSQVTI